jgi:hypothetical protein
MKFSEILSRLDEGKMASRAAWGLMQFIYKTVGNTVTKDFIPKFASLPQDVKDFLVKRDKDVVFHSSYTLYNMNGEMEPGWLPSQADLQADDWDIISSNIDY